MVPILFSFQKLAKINSLLLLVKNTLSQISFRQNKYLDAARYPKHTHCVQVDNRLNSLHPSSFFGTLSNTYPRQKNHDTLSTHTLHLDNSNKFIFTLPFVCARFPNTNNNIHQQQNVTSSLLFFIRHRERDIEEERKNLILCSLSFFVKIFISPYLSQPVSVTGIQNEHMTISLSHART